MILNIIVTYEFPPIHFRGLDYSAVLDGYSGDFSEPVGFGNNKYQAIKNLIEQLEESKHVCQ